VISVRYVLQRGVLSLLTLLLVSLITFLFTQALPGDAAVMIAGRESSPERIEAIRQSLGLNRPLYVQYFDWLLGVLQGDFGNSFLFERPVTEILIPRIPRSLYLTTVAILIATVTSIPLGVIAASKQNEIIDDIISLLTFGGIIIPNWLWGLIFVYIFAVSFNILPPSGYADPYTDPLEFVRLVIMPAVALGWYLMAYMTRMTRSSMIDELKKNYILTAKAKGLSKNKVLFKHALKNALIPTLTVLGFQIGFIFGGMIVIEEVFNWPGIGRLTFRAILERDIPVIQASVMIIATVFVTANFFVEILYTALDPRIEKGSE